MRGTFHIDDEESILALWVALRDSSKKREIGESIFFDYDPVDNVGSKVKAKNVTAHIDVSNEYRPARWSKYDCSPLRFDPQRHRLVQPSTSGEPDADPSTFGDYSAYMIKKHKHTTRCSCGSITSVSTSDVVEEWSVLPMANDSCDVEFAISVDGVFIDELYGYDFDRFMLMFFDMTTDY